MSDCRCSELVHDCEGENTGHAYDAGNDVHYTRLGAYLYKRGDCLAKYGDADGSFATGKISALFAKIGQVPWIIVIMLIVVAVVHVFLNYTKHGRYMYVIGGNIEAAKLSGIAVNKYRVLAYILSAGFAAIGGIILASRVMTAEVNAGAPYLMDAVAAAFIGFSVAGAGKPNAFGTFIGAILIGILQNGLVMMSVPYYAMDIVKGTVLAFALALTYYKKK